VVSLSARPTSRGGGKNGKGRIPSEVLVVIGLSSVEPFVHPGVGVKRFVRRSFQYCHHVDHAAGCRSSVLWECCSSPREASQGHCALCFEVSDHGF